MARSSRTFASPNRVSMIRFIGSPDLLTQLWPFFDAVGEVVMVSPAGAERAFVLAPEADLVYDICPYAISADFTNGI